MSHNDQPPETDDQRTKGSDPGALSWETLASGLSGLASTEKVSTSVIFGGRTGARLEFSSELRARGTRSYIYTYYIIYYICMCARMVQCMHTHIHYVYIYIYSVGGRRIHD